MKSVICASLATLTLLVSGLFAQTSSPGGSIIATTTNGDYYGGLYGGPNDPVRIVMLQSDLSTLNMNPPITGRDAMGTAMVEIRLERGGVVGSTTTTDKATVTINVNAQTTQSESITGVQISSGMQGANGAMLFDFPLTSPVPTVVNQMTNARVQMEVTEQDKIMLLNQIVSNPGAYYLVVKTQSTPNGQLRGQLMEGSLAATRRLERRLANYAEKDLVDIKRLVVRLAQKEGLITSAEADDLLTPLENRPQ